MIAVTERLAGALRPWQMRGKGFAFDFFTPHAGIRRVPVWGDYEMTLDLANAIHRQIFMGCFGRQMTTWTQRLLPPGGVFLDVGAHIGYFTLLAAHRVGQRGRVVAIEPNPTAFAALERHLEGGRVQVARVEQVALSDAPGSLALYAPPPGEARDYNVTVMPRSDWQRIDVPCVRLDDRVRDWDLEHVDVMKIDVEGAEPQVLRGGAESLRRGLVKHIVIEVNGPRLTEGGSSPEKLVLQLKDLGFVPARLAGRRAVRIDSAKLDLAPESEYDRLFVHHSAE